MKPDLRVLPTALLMGALLTACGGEGPIDIPSPTGSITASAPSPTRSPSRSERPEPSETPTEPDNPDETSAPPSDSPSEKPPKSEPDETSTPSTPAEEATEATDPAEDDGLPSWFWWGLGLLGAALAAILIPRARRRRAWDADLMAVRADVTWFTQELIPTLQQSASPDEVAGGWTFAVSRVTGAEDQLTVLEANAPDEARASQARTLRDAVRGAAQKMEDLLVLRDPTTLARDLAAIQTQLAAALQPVAGA